MLLRLDKALLLIPVFLAGCDRPFTGHGRYLISYQGEGPNSDGALLLDLEARLTNRICDNRGASPISCIAASGNIANSDILILQEREVSGSKVQKLVLLPDGNSFSKRDIGPSLGNEGIGSISPDGTKICFPVFEADAIHSSIWIRNLVSNELTQISDISTGFKWYAYPNWTGNGQSVVFFDNRRTSDGRVNVQVMRYSMREKFTYAVDGLSNVVSIAYAPFSSDVVAAWTKDGLVLFKPGVDNQLLLPMQWCNKRRLMPNTLSWDKSGRFLLFSVYDPRQRRAEVYQLSVETNKIAEVFSLRSSRIVGISLVK